MNFCRFLENFPKIIMNCLLEAIFSHDFAIGLYLVQYTSLHIAIDYQVIVFDNNTYYINEFHLFSLLKI